MSQKFSERLRERVRKHIAPCPTCGHRDIDSIDEIARSAGVDHAQLARFLLGEEGGDLGLVFIDTLMTWLDERPEPLRFTFSQVRSVNVPAGTETWLQNAGYAETPVAERTD